MIHDLTPYPSYKDSGVPWLGEVPAHWEVKPLKRWVSINERVLTESTPPEYEFNYIDIGAVGTGRLIHRPQRINFAGAPSRAKRVLQRGDTIVSTVRTYLKAVYFVDDDSSEIVCSTGFAVFTPHSATVPKYVSYLAQSEAFTDRVSSESVGIAYPAIAEGRLASFHVSIPPLPEQTAIVRYLDHIDRRIRRYIHSKQKLIKLLEEEKQAIINQAVTRGLDPNVKLKPSGVEWLGEVPEHWDFNRGKFYFREVDVRSTTGKEELLSVSHITGVTPRSQKNINMFKAESYIGYKLCNRGQIAVNTMWAWMAAIGVSKYHGIISSSYHTYEQINGHSFHNDFLDILLRSTPYKILFTINSTGITASRLRLYPEDFLNIRFLCPPRDEQESIVSWLRDATNNLDVAIDRTRREISLLREYRTRLIADVVTGKLDVREAAARLPEETDEPEDFDDTLAGEEEAGEEELEIMPEEET